MDCHFINNKKEWNDFIIKHNGSFLQSWEWGDFQKDYGREVIRLGVKDSGELTAGVQIILYDLPAWRTYFFSPRGPVRLNDAILDKVRELAWKKKAIFWRLEPAQNLKPEIYGLIKVKDFHPQKTLVVDLNQTEEDLKNQMKQKTRYNLKLAEKKGVEVRVSKNMNDMDVFYEMATQTARRQQIKIFPKSYYQLLLHVLGDMGLARLYLARYQGQIIAANLIVVFHKTMTYLHGGSSDEHRNVMSPYLLQWQAMRDAKKAGLSYYDFFGISDSIPSWEGITRFKRGFSGQEVEYPGTFEIPLNNIWYQAYRLAKKIK